MPERFQFIIKNIHRRRRY